MSHLRDLTAHEAATRAREVWHYEDARKAGQQFLYYSLSQDKNCPQALLVLTDMMRMLAGEEVAIVVSEYTYNIAKDPEVKSRINLIRRIALNQLDLLSHPIGNISALTIEEWEHSNDFVVSQEGVTRITSRVLNSHTLEQAFEAARLLLGVRAGLMVPKVRSTAATNFDDCFDPNNFRQCDNYEDFLSAENLDSEF